ncbi:mRNA capping enzyme, partial [uncultured virus]
VRDGYALLQQGTAAGLGYAIDGLILADEARPYQCGRDPRLFKYKLPEEHTVDLQLGVSERDPSLVTLYAADRGTLTCVGRLRMSAQELADCGLPHGRLLDRMIVEFRWDARRHEWWPVKHRTDKNMPNNRFTLERTIRNIEENIRPEELHALLCGTPVPASS